MYTFINQVKHSIYYCISPSAGIGRQSDLKIRWYITVNVQVVSWIKVIIYVVYDLTVYS